MHLNYSILILLNLVVGLILLVIFRKLYSILPKTTKDTSMKDSNKTTRIAEGIILLCAGIAIFVFTATNKSTGGRLLILDQFNRGFAMVNIIIALIAAAGLLAGVILTFRYKTSVGFTIAVVFMAYYGIILNNHSDFLKSLAPEDSTISKVPLLLRLSNSPVDGAELWVNGVFLGQTPVQTTVEEFLDKVPYWPEPPEGYRDRTDDLRTPYYSPAGSSGYNIYEGWEQFELLDISDRYNNIASKVRDKKFYARVKFDDQWGYFVGGGGGSGNNDSIEQHFSVIFPSLNERLDTMLDIARLNDYQVGEEWFEAMETYGQVGINAIYNAIEKEPDISKVIDDWAIWKYQLDKVTDENHAWEVFEKICREADEIQSYSTMSIAGRAVEMLVSKINPEQIVNEAIGLIRSKRTYGWILWRLNGKAQFGMTYRPEGFLTPSGNIIGGRADRRSDEPLVSDYAVAHTILAFDKLLDSQDYTRPNIVELKVVPNLLCWHYENDTSLRLAASLGGPDIERFLCRNKWRADYKDLPYGERLFLSPQKMNPWLFLLANLDSSFGHKFRKDNKSLLMKFADSIDIRWFEDSGLLGQNVFSFLFIDKNFALEYWPEFKIRTLQNHYALKLQFIYLVNMEPVSTVDMYIQAWRGYSEDYSNFQDALRILEQLPQEKHDLVIEAIEKSLKEDTSHIKGMSNSEGDNYLLREIKSRYWSKIRTAKSIIAGLKENTGEYKPQAVSDWLAHEEPGHPLVNMLAESDEPQLRLLVMGALRENPTPANREILEKLLNDSDEQVRNAAQEAAKELENLKEITLSQLAAQ